MGRVVIDSMFRGTVVGFNLTELMKTCFVNS